MSIVSGNCFGDGDFVNTGMAANAPKIMNYSSITRQLNFSVVNTWNVKGLALLGEGRIESLPFRHQDGTDWRLVLSKNSDRPELSLLLNRPKTLSRRKVPPRSVHVKAREILPSGEIRNEVSGDCCLAQGEETELMTIANDAVDDDCDDCEVTIQCEVCVRLTRNEELPVPDAGEAHASVVSCLDEMLHREVHADFELRASGAVLKAHRAILAVRSPYFAAMLQPHTREARDGFVVLSDAKPEVLRQVLLYVYTGVAPALEDMAWDLMIAADKYQLQQLKRQCEAHIASTLDVDNAAETAANACLYSCDMLWDRAVAFIKQNLCQVMRSSGWAKIIVSHPKVVEHISKLMV